MALAWLQKKIHSTLGLGEFGMFKTGIAAALLLTSSSVAGAQEDKSVENAFILCRLIDGTGLASQPCEVAGWGSSVTATLDMNSGEARQLCGQISGLMSEKNLRFREGWTLQIRSPYSGDNSIAFCNL